MTEYRQVPKDATTIRKRIRALRKFIDSATIPTLEVRIAYEVEQQLRWVMMDVTGWPDAVTSVKETAAMIRTEQLT